MNEKKFSFSSLSNDIIILFALILLCIAISIMSPFFFTANNLTNVVLQSAINATIACGMTFVILTGGIDLSVGSILALSGVSFGMCLSNGVNFFVALGVCLLIGVVVGCINGLLVTHAKLPPFIATLGLMSIARGMALYMTDGRSISGFGSPLSVIGSGGFLYIPNLIVIMIITYAIGMFILKFTRAGRYVYAIGGNLEATRLSGINTNKYTIMVYAISGLTASIAAIMMAARLDSTQPIAGEGYELDAIAATVIGGTSTTGGEGKMTGTIIGALIISVLKNGLNLMNVSSYVQQIVIGLVIIFAVMIDRMRKR